jgi:hypothetical protein
VWRVCHGKLALAFIKIVTPFETIFWKEISRPQLTSCPYSLSKGPNVTKVKIQLLATINPYDKVILEIKASDSAHSSVNYQMAGQNIEEI